MNLIQLFLLVLKSQAYFIDQESREINFKKAS